MKRIAALTVGIAMTVAACGGSNETVAEPDEGRPGGGVLQHDHAGRLDPQRRLLTVCGVSACDC